MPRTDQVAEGNKVLFKKCPSCGFEWPDIDIFLRDPEVQLIGYQVHFDELTAGIFLFDHTCGTTFGIRAGVFSHLYKGPIFKFRATGTKDCPTYCLNKNILIPCPAQCECAYVREIVVVIRNWTKNNTGK